jgi:hypothetical protein
MASTITITCPDCEKQMKAPPNLEGKKIRCKGCGNIFVARADKPGAKAPTKSGPAKAAPAKGGAKAPADPNNDSGDAEAYKVTGMSFAPRCPECANEMESEEAIICLVCGYNTVTRTRSRTRKVRDVTGGARFLWLLPGIICVILALGQTVFAILYYAQAQYWFFGAAARGWDSLPPADRAQLEDNMPWYYFLVKPGFKVWVVVISAFIVFLEGRFAVKRLILHTTPPEVEEKL